MKTLSLPRRYEWATKFTSFFEAFTKVLIPRGVNIKNSIFSQNASKAAQTLLTLFKNDPTEKLLVISSYPAHGATHGKNVGGIAAFAKNTVVALKNAAPSMDITVLGEKIPGYMRETYTEDGVTINRVWERNSYFTFFNILKEILTYERHTKKILIEFGFSIYGDLRYLLTLPFLLAALKLLRKDVYFVFHEVVPSAQEVAGHMNLSQNSFKTELFNILFYAFYKYCLMFVTKSIVLEDALAKRLQKYGKQHDVAVIPIGVEEFDTMPTVKSARRKLKVKDDTFVILCFGFLAWYKGTDWIVNAIEEIKKTNTNGKKIQLILAGGENKDRVNKDYYRKYVETIERKCEENGIILTGFVKEDEISTYFQASDLILFPYRILIGASAPLTLAFSFKKPFFVSRPMSCVLKADDIKALMKQYKLKDDDISFDLNDDFGQKLKRIQKSSVLQKKLTDLSTSLSEHRHWNEIGKMYYSELF